MLRRIAVALCCAGLLGATALAGDEPKPACCTKKATEATDKAGKLRCSLTGKEVEKCCCESRPGGKLYCPLAKKQIDKCCCTEVKAEDKDPK
jgi:hypothetical protein